LSSQSFSTAENDFREDNKQQELSGKGKEFEKEQNSSKKEEALNTRQV
jgi:hypothetical protein